LTGMSNVTGSFLTRKMRERAVEEIGLMFDYD
jgi:hypothetical protein